MGTGSSSKHSTRGVIHLISNCKFQISDFRAFLRLSLILCAFAGNSFSQITPESNSINQTDDSIAKQFQAVFEKGTVEEKRSALFEIRNLKSEVYSKTAIPALKDSDEIVRATAAFSVIYLTKDEALRALAPNLADKAEIVRRETAYALGKVQNSSAISVLIQTFQKDKSAEVKNASIVALGEIGDASAVDFLTQILRQKPNDENEFLRRSAARSIGQIAQIIQIKESSAVTPESFLPEKYKLLTLEKYRNLSTIFSQFRNSVAVLTQILQNRNEADDTKRETAFALGAIGDLTALSVLQNNLNSKDYYLAEICKEAVKKLSSVYSG